MNKKSILALMAGAVILSGCRVDITPDEREARGGFAVNLRADIEKSILKVTGDNKFEASDEVGLYMKPAGDPLTAAYGNVKNLQMTLDGQNLVANPQVYYPESGSVDFIAYYPYTAAVGSDCTVDVDVAGQDSGLPVEVLYSNNATDKTKTDSPVTLNFLYSLAKLEITVTAGENSPLSATDFEDMTVSIEGMFTQAKLQLADGTFTDRDGQQTVTMHKTGSTTTSATFEALVLPTAAADGEITFVFDVNGVAYLYKWTAGYESHSLYRLNFAIFTASPEREAILLKTNILPRNEYDHDLFVEATPKMTMTTAKEGEVSLRIGGTGKMIIDWGDGTPHEVYTASGSTPSDLPVYNHSYSDAASCTIIIYGENITHLICTDNQLTNLDVSRNTALEYLNCYKNPLTSLDVSKNTVLEFLNCRENQLTNLDVSNNTALERLLCMSNKLTNLDVSNNTALEILFCDNNQLTSLDVSNNTALEILWCAFNKLTSLNVSNNTMLDELWCSSNQLTSLDVSNNTMLTSFVCSDNQLTGTALNALFETLHSNTGSKSISVSRNPGATDCDPSIAKAKGWSVH